MLDHQRMVTWLDASHRDTDQDILKRKREIDLRRRHAIYRSGHFATAGSSFNADINIKCSFGCKLISAGCKPRRAVVDDPAGVVTSVGCPFSGIDEAQ